ncbi:MAG TPA: DUF2807 domain-containing protein [Flavobacteriaceae bacterium]|nr:DUF2807 domain-containing protein [Flavobacteriaceae bacterium]
MKRIPIYILFLLPFLSFAQEKLKGNKQVTVESRAINNFNKIEVIDNLEVLLTSNNQQSVSVEADSNLQEAIITTVEDGVLTIKTAGRIVKNKALKIHLNVDNNLLQINTYNNAKVLSETIVNIDSLYIEAFDNSDIDLKLNAKSVIIRAKKNTNLSFNILTEFFNVYSEENAKIRGNINTKDASIELLDRSNMDIDGVTNSLTLEANGTSIFKGKSFVSNTSKVTLSNKASTYINTSKNIEILARNNAEVYIYNAPKITLTEFFDKAAIYKRE